MIENQLREIQLRDGLAAVRRRIDRATEDAGRTFSPPRLIVVTKFHPADDIRTLAALGVSDVGESRDQEASDKSTQLLDLDLHWHFIGQLQSNKAKSVAHYAHSVHSVDRLQLVAALERAMVVEQEKSGRAALECFIQVSLDEVDEVHRGGAVADAVPALAEQVASARGLELAGVMAVAPLGAEPEAAFETLAAISARLTGDYPFASGISAGMSQDLEAAIRLGATHLRIGSDILGPRPAVR